MSMYTLSGLGHVVSFACAGAVSAPAGWLEQLDRVAGGIVEQHLVGPDADEDLAAEARTLAFESGDRRFQVLDLETESVPPTRGGHAAVRQRLTRRAGAGAVQQQPQV